MLDIRGYRGNYINSVDGGVEGGVCFSKSDSIFAKVEDSEESPKESQTQYGVHWQVEFIWVKRTYIQKDIIKGTILEISVKIFR